MADKMLSDDRQAADLISRPECDSQFDELARECPFPSVRAGVEATIEALNSVLVEQEKSLASDCFPLLTKFTRIDQFETAHGTLGYSALVDVFSALRELRSEMVQQLYQVVDSLDVNLCGRLADEQIIEFLTSHVKPLAYPKDLLGDFDAAIHRFIPEDLEVPIGTVVNLSRGPETEIAESMVVNRYLSIAPVSSPLNDFYSYLSSICGAELPKENFGYLQSILQEYSLLQALLPVGHSSVLLEAFNPSEHVINPHFNSVDGCCDRSWKFACVGILREAAEICERQIEKVAEVPHEVIRVTSLEKEEAEFFASKNNEVVAIDPLDPSIVEGGSSGTVVDGARYSAVLAGGASAFLFKVNGKTSSYVLQLPSLPERLRISHLNGKETGYIQMYQRVRKDRGNNLSPTRTLVRCAHLYSVPDSRALVADVKRLNIKSIRLLESEFFSPASWSQTNEVIGSGCVRLYRPFKSADAHYDPGTPTTSEPLRQDLVFQEAVYCSGKWVEGKVLAKRAEAVDLLSAEKESPVLVLATSQGCSFFEREIRRAIQGKDIPLVSTSDTMARLNLAGGKGFASGSSFSATVVIGNHDNVKATCNYDIELKPEVIEALGDSWDAEIARLRETVELAGVRQSVLLVAGEGKRFIERAFSPVINMADVTLVYLKGSNSFLDAKLSTAGGLRGQGESLWNQYRRYSGALPEGRLSKMLRGSGVSGKQKFLTHLEERFIAVNPDARSIRKTLRKLGVI